MLVQIVKALEGYHFKTLLDITVNLSRANVEKTLVFYGSKAISNFLAAAAAAKLKVRLPPHTKVSTREEADAQLVRTFATTTAELHFSELWAEEYPALKNAPVKEETETKEKKEKKGSDKKGGGMKEEKDQGKAATTKSGPAVGS